MGRKPLSSYPPDIAARMRADFSRSQREAWTRRETNGFGTRQNGALQADTQAKISQAIRARWAEGNYDNRVNGMTGRFGQSHPNWAWGEPNFHEILAQHEEAVCRFCGETEEKLDVHHLDERHSNYLLSNLVWACVPCHAWKFHYQKKKAPFTTITKTYTFEYSHILPWHPGKCSQLHGHSGRLSVTLRGRLDPNGVVTDFSDLTADVKAAVIEPFDHHFLNDFLTNPTSENLLWEVWQRLESIGAKGLYEVRFAETGSSECSLTASDVIEAFGWDRVDESSPWTFVRKPSELEVEEVFSDG